MAMNCEIDHQKHHFKNLEENIVVLQKFEAFKYMTKDAKEIPQKNKL
jgi:hypothetical protein